MISDKEAWSGHADCRRCTLRSSVLFAGLTEQDFDRIRQPVERYVLLPGTVMFRAGEQGNRMFTIRSGMIKLAQYLPDGTQRIVRILGSTDLAGLEALLGLPYQHDAVVLKTVETCSLPVSVVQTLAKSNSELYQELLKRWQKALTEADTWLTQFSTGSARQRVARLLLQLAQGENGYECTLFSCEDMGAILGLSTETVSRNIAEFKRQQLVVGDGQTYFLQNRASLQQIAERG